MKKNLHQKTLQAFFLFCALWGCISSTANAQTPNLCTPPCAAYTSAYPPPYNCSYPCLQSVFTSDPACCTVGFDEYCFTKLKQTCDINPDPCKFERCRPSGCATSYLPPYCPGPCVAYGTTAPPPGSLFSTTVNGILFELFQCDGYCCFNQFDAYCWDEVLDSLNLKTNCLNGSQVACNDSDPNTLDAVDFALGCTHTPIVAGIPSQLVVNLKLFLEGAYIGNGKMDTTLRKRNIIPTAQPFNQAPWNYTGTELTTLVAMPSGVVDWVLVEIREMTTKSLLAQKAAFLMANGLIRDIDNVTAGVKFTNAGLTPNANYYVSVRTRNHLPVMSAFPLFLSSRSLYDFTIAEGQAYLYQQMKLIDEGLPGYGDEKYGLWAGDMDGNGKIEISDFNVYLSTTELAKINQYRKADVNLNRVVTYEDFNIYTNNVGTDCVTLLQY